MLLKVAAVPVIMLSVDATPVRPDPSPDIDPLTDKPPLTDKSPPTLKSPLAAETFAALNALNATNSKVSPLAAADVRPTTDPSVAVKS